MKKKQKQTNKREEAIEINESLGKNGLSIVFITGN